MTDAEYVFAQIAQQQEYERLQSQAATWDWLSQGKLMALGLSPGATCLEAGVGAGSMARWMATVVGATGAVVGIDVDDRFFPATEPYGVTLVKDDLLITDQLAEARFDFAHARLVLLHISASERPHLLRRLLHTLKPGGWFVCLDPAFHDRVTGDELTAPLFAALAQATSPHADFAYGPSAAADLVAAGFTEVESQGVYLRTSPPAVHPGYGSVQYNATHDALRAIEQFVTTANVLTPDAVQAAIAAIADCRAYTTSPLTITWGRRPLSQAS